MYIHISLKFEQWYTSKKRKRPKGCRNLKARHGQRQEKSRDELKHSRHAEE